MPESHGLDVLNEKNITACRTPQVKQLLGTLCCLAALNGQATKAQDHGYAQRRSSEGSTGALDLFRLTSSLGGRCDMNSRPACVQIEECAPRVLAACGEE